MTARPWMSDTYPEPRAAALKRFDFLLRRPHVLSRCCLDVPAQVRHLLRACPPRGVLVVRPGVRFRRSRRERARPDLGRTRPDRADRARPAAADPGRDSPPTT